MSKYDIIIVGSGLGGLACGAILSKEGFNVCVLEKNEQFGGCFQTYKRRGRLLDTGIHYIGSMEEGQVMNQYFRYFGILDKLKMRKLDTDAFDRIFHNGEVYDYAMGHDRFVDVLCRKFPAEKANLTTYVTRLKEVGNLIQPDILREGRIAREGLHYFNTSAAGLIGELTSNPELQQVLAATGLLYGGRKEVSTFYQHAMVINSYLEGAYRFVDGSMQVSLELIRVIRENGGTVLNNKEVTRIVVEEEEVKGVMVNGEELMECNYAISNLHPQQTFNITDKCRSIKNAYLSRIRSLENTYGIFTVYLLMNPGSYPYLNHNLYLHDRNDVWYDKEKNAGRITNCMVSMEATSGENRFANVVTILTPMYMDEVIRWEDTLPEKRGEDYREFKARKTEEILLFLKRQGIDLQPHIETFYSTTPLSYRDYTGTTNGSAYGIIKDYHYPERSLISTRTKIRNLLLTGQNLNVHGALGVTLTALYTCSEFIGQEYLAKKIGNA